MQLSAVLLCFSSDRFYFICKQYNAVPFSSPKHQTFKFLAVESQQHWSEVLAWDKLHFLHWTMPCNNIDSVPLDARNNTYNDFFYSNSIKIFSHPHCAQIPQWSMYTMRRKVSVWLFQIFMNVRYNVNVKDLDSAISYYDVPVHNFNEEDLVLCH